MQEFHGLCLAAPRSGEGKSLISMGLMRYFTRCGLQVQAFKCGPDYIDPTFHAEATGRVAYNLDTWMMGEAGVQSLWAHSISKGADMAICEGVMGLFDGRSVGSLEGSTAHCAKALDIPVVLVFNARGMAASAAALAEGFYTHAKAAGVRIVGFIANNVGSARHTDLLREALALHHLPPLLGALPRNEAWHLPERQLGLIPSAEVSTQGITAHWYDALATAMETYCDVEAILQLSALPRLALPTLEQKPHAPKALQHGATAAAPRIAVAKDSAFCFYYDANQRHLETLGFELVPFSPMHDTHLPENITAIYLGGGYPEVFAKELSENISMRTSIATFAENNGEIYAECGGYMYLCKHVITEQGQIWDMCGVFHATATMGKGIRSLGYRQVQLLCEAPLGLAKNVYRGHEFHWSDIVHHEEYAPLYTVSLKDSTHNAGAIYKNVRAGYIHLYWGIGCYEG